MDLTLGKKSSWDTLRGREGRIFSKCSKIYTSIAYCRVTHCKMMQRLFVMFMSFELLNVCSPPLADVELIAFAVFSSLQEKPSATLNYLRGLGNVIYFYKSQKGTRISPARSCRELHLEHPDYPSGRWTITYCMQGRNEITNFPVRLSFSEQQRWWRRRRRRQGCLLMRRNWILSLCHISFNFKFLTSLTIHQV